MSWTSLLCNGSNTSQETLLIRGILHFLSSCDPDSRVRGLGPDDIIFNVLITYLKFMKTVGTSELSLYGPWKNVLILWQYLIFY